MIHFGIDKAGFNDRLVCGTINYFEGWAINADKNNRIIQATQKAKICVLRIRAGNFRKNYSADILQSSNTFLVL